jgi:NAD(P)H dehydrogenase (quinone)
MILVTGATGNFGKATIDFLLKKGTAASTISALVRDEAKAADLKTKGISIKIGDYDNYDSLVAAFKGVDKLVLVSGSDIEKRGQQQLNAVKAAKEAGVKHVVYTSFERKDETDSSPIAFISKSHIATEKAIKESGLVYTVLRNNLYLDVLPMFLGENVLDTGVFFAAGDTKSAFASRDDMAEATANILIEEGHENKEYQFSNSENVSFVEIAKIISQAAGKDISYTSPTAEIYTDTLTKAGVPAGYVGMFAGFAEGIRQGEFTASTNDLEKLLGRKPLTAKEYLKVVYEGK